MKALYIGSFDTFFKAVLIATGIVAWSLPVWNITINPYQIFNAKYSIGSRYSSSTTNERYLKVEFLLKEKKYSPDSPEIIIGKINNNNELMNDGGEKNHNHDAFIVGSSIMGLVDPKLLNKHFPNRNFYNLAFLAAKPDEILATLQGLKRNGVTIRTVFYGLEPIAFTDTKSYGPAYELHPESSGKNRQLIIFNYLFAPSLMDGFSRLVTCISGKTSVRYDIESTGRYFLDRYDSEIKRDHSAFIRKQFPDDVKPVKAPPWIDNRFDDFSKLVKWLKKEGVDANFYFNPLHHYIADAYGPERMAYFKERITFLTDSAKVADCVSLLQGKDIAYHYYDYKHFRPTENAAIIACGLSKRF